MSQAAYIGPKGVDLAVDEERFREVVVRDEYVGCQVERLLTVVVLGEPWPAVWPKVGGNGERSELFGPCVSVGGVGVSVVTKG
jgi:hypothetical protein